MESATDKAESYQKNPKDIIFNFGETIKRKREELGKTLSEVANEVGVDMSYLCKFENNYQIRPAKEPVLRSLAIALGFRPEWLIIKSGKLPFKYQDFFRDNPDYFLALFEEMERKQNKEK